MKKKQIVPELSSKPGLLFRRFEIVKTSIFRQIGVGLNKISWQGLNRKKITMEKLSQKKIGGSGSESLFPLIWTFGTRILAQKLSPESPDFSLNFLLIDIHAQKTNFKIDGL